MDPDPDPGGPKHVDPGDLDPDSDPDSDPDLDLDSDPDSDPDPQHCSYEQIEFFRP
jgi:hypothetical protein